MQTVNTVLPAELVRAYSITVTKVGQLDASGEPCPWCSTEGADIAAQVYAQDMAGQDVFLEGCVPCLPAALAYHVVCPVSGVTVEVEL